MTTPGTAATTQPIGTAAAPLPPSITVPFTVYIDHREKLPYTFGSLYADARDKNQRLTVPTKFVQLDTGDYTIAGMETLIAVERKTLSDLYSTLGQHRDRFEEEHRRLSQLAFAAVVVEADWYTIMRRPPARSKLSPKCVSRTAVSWCQKYGVHWLTCPDRAFAEAMTFRLLEKAWFEHTGAASYSGYIRKHKKAARMKPTKREAVPPAASPTDTPAKRRPPIIIGTRSDQASEERIERVLEQCDTICDLCEEVPERGEDFAISVHEKTCDIRETIERMHHVTEAQEEALDNMQSGIEAWIH